MQTLEIIQPDSPVAYKFTWMELWHAIAVSFITYFAMEFAPDLLAVLNIVEGTSTLPEPPVLYKLLISLIGGSVRAVVGGILTVLTKKYLPR